MTDNIGQLTRWSVCLTFDTSCHAWWHDNDFTSKNLVLVTFCTSNQLTAANVSLIGQHLFVLLGNHPKDYILTFICNCEQICSFLSSVFQLNLTRVWLLAAALFCWAPSVHCTAGWWRGDVTINSYDNTELSLAEPAKLGCYWSIQILAWLITPGPGRRGKRGKGVEQLLAWHYLDEVICMNKRIC